MRFNKFVANTPLFIIVVFIGVICCTSAVLRTNASLTNVEIRLIPEYSSFFDCEEREFFGFSHKINVVRRAYFSTSDIERVKAEISGVTVIKNPVSYRERR